MKANLALKVQPHFLVLKFLGLQRGVGRFLTPPKETSSPFRERLKKINVKMSVSHRICLNLFYVDETDV